MASLLNLSAVKAKKVAENPLDIVAEQMAAGAFERTCQHLRERSDQVQNMDLMTIGGFCRNCLAKWMVLEARKLSQLFREDEASAARFTMYIDGERERIIRALDSMGYDEAAQEVYGCTYPEWKRKHQKKASEEKMKLYNESSHLHATHDKSILEKVGSFPEQSSEDSINYCQKYIPSQLLVRLKAGAFESLCQHLRERSDEVQNMDLMTISGFCRNCLAKWMVVEARCISDGMKGDNYNVPPIFLHQHQKIILSLDSFGYDEAAKIVYGCTYPEWKERHQKKATNEQLSRFSESSHLHAKHNKELLATRSTSGYAPLLQQIDTPAAVSQKEKSEAMHTQQQSLLSDVCCQDVDNIPAQTAGPSNCTISSHQTPRPPKGHMELRIAILTVSDRAASNSYETGDLSGPAVEQTILRQVEQINSSFNDQKLSVASIEKTIVADDISDIKRILMSWSGKSSPSDGESDAVASSYDLIFTTGGTGFSSRDVTPEATLAILDRECQGLMSWASIELTAKQPLATLSRAAAGLCGNSLIINLPGNPKGAAQVVDLIFPLLLHALKDLSSV